MGEGYSPLRLVKEINRRKRSDSNKQKLSGLRRPFIEMSEPRVSPQEQVKKRDK